MIQVVKETTGTGSETVALVARQPICDPNQNTFAYELLFRASAANAAAVFNADRATAQVIVNSFLEIGFERLLGSSPAFINVTDHFILADYCRSLPKDRVVFEILEDTVPNQPLMEALRQLTNAGYRFALDDYTFQPHMAALLPFCTFLKVDVRQAERGQIAAELSHLRGKRFKFLAEKVETIGEFEFCREAGFHYFQGYFFCRPRMLSGSTVPYNRVAICRLLAKLHQPDVSTHEIEAIVGEDLSVSYRLLRYINSASVALTKMVQSINHAVRLVGTEQIRLLASLILLTSLDDKPRELLTTSLIRAKMCELLARRLGHHSTESFFTVGLFSALDAFLNCSMQEALELLPLAEDIRGALLDGSGEAGEILRSVLSYEQAGWGTSAVTAGHSVTRDAYMQSLVWADSLVKSFSAHAGG